MINVEEILASFHVIPVIVVAAYCIAELLKKFVLKTDSQKSLLPVICGGLGGIVGILLYYVYPAALDSATSNVLGAIADGAFSGIMATGCNQIYKQLKRFFTPTDSSN